jgi:ADP-ribosylation factor-binding protein GGA
MGVSSQAQSTATPPPAADPFASLVSASPRATSSPFQPPAQSQPAPASSSLLDLVGDTGPSPQPARQAAPVEDDEWDFASALPASNALPSTNKIQVLNSQLRVDFAARRVPNQTRQIHIVAIFSNTTTQSIGDLHFQVAVEKVSHLPLFNTVHFLDEFTDN